MQVERASQYDFAEESGTLSDMNAGKDDGDTLQSGEVGELAKVEIADSGQGIFSEYERLSLGGVPDPQLRTKQARVDGDLQNSTPADVPDGTKVRIRITDKRRSRTFAETRWFDKSEVEAASIENLPVLRWAGWEDATFGGSGRIVVIEVRNPSSSFNASYADSSFEFPFIGAY